MKKFRAFLIADKLNSGFEFVGEPFNFSYITVNDHS